MNNCVLERGSEQISRDSRGTMLVTRGAEDAMSTNDARREALSVWLMEFSVLWAVFPLLDQLVENRGINFPIMAWSVGMSLTGFVFGMILKKGETT